MGGLGAVYRLAGAASTPGLKAGAFPKDRQHFAPFADGAQPTWAWTWT
jgi:hypothetical protein